MVGWRGTGDLFDLQGCVTVTPSDVDDGSLTVVLCSAEDTTDVEDVSSESKSVEGSVMDSDKEPKSEEEQVTCDMCGQVSYDWESFGEEIWKKCHVLKEQGMDSKAVRYHAY